MAEPLAWGMIELRTTLNVSHTQIGDGKLFERLVPLSDGHPRILRNCNHWSNARGRRLLLSSTTEKLPTCLNRYKGRNYPNITLQIRFDPRWWMRAVDELLSLEIITNLTRRIYFKVMSLRDIDDSTKDLPLDTSRLGTNDYEV